jgi:hypothetical protein
VGHHLAYQQVHHSHSKWRKEQKKNDVLNLLLNLMKTKKLRISSTNFKEDKLKEIHLHNQPLKSKVRKNFESSKEKQLIAFKRSSI